MKQVIYVTTMKEAVSIAFEIDEAVMIAENEYTSDKDLKGVIIYVEGM